MSARMMLNAVSIGRAGNTRRVVAIGSSDGEPDQLPGRPQAAHDQDQCIGQKLVPAAGARIKHRLDVLERGLGEISDVARQPAAERSQGFADGEDPEEVVQVLDRRRGADLADQPPMRLLVGADLREHRTDAPGHLILKGPLNWS